MNTQNKEGIVVEIMPNQIYAVEFDGVVLKCYLAGKMKLHKIKVLVGDRVLVIIDPYKGNCTNRIIERMKPRD